MLGYKETTRGYDGNTWIFREEKDINMEQFWIWSKADGCDYEGNPIKGDDCFKDFEKERLFDLGKCMWRKHSSVFQDKFKLFHNDIANIYRMIIFH